MGQHRAAGPLVDHVVTVVTPDAPASPPPRPDAPSDQPVSSPRRAYRAALAAQASREALQAEQAEQARAAAAEAWESRAELRARLAREALTATASLTAVVPPVTPAATRSLPTVAAPVAAVSPVAPQPLAPEPRVATQPVVEPVVEPAAVALTTADDLPLTRRELRARTTRKPQRTTLVTHLPRVGIVAALGVATIVTPVVGLSAVDASQTADAATAMSATSSAAPSRAAQVLAAAPTVSADFSVIPVKEPVPVVDPPASMVSTVGQVLTADELAAIRTQAEQASRNQERAALPGCDGKVSDPGAANGRLDTDDLCEIWVDGRLLRADAALALARLNAEFATKFGEDLCVTDAYRSYSAQVSVRWRKPGLAARPGTSQHGWALAVDLCEGEASPSGARHDWMRENAPDFGWDNPEWARRGGSGPFEPWHWEYVAGQDEDGS